MGAFKEKTGKTRVGSALGKVGGFFSGIFKKKDTGSTTTTPTKTVTAKGATQPISGSSQVSGSFWGELATVLGTAGLAFLGTKVPSSTDPNVTVAEQQQIETQNQQDAQDTGSGIFVTIGLVILTVIAFFYIKSRK